MDKNLKRLKTEVLSLSPTCPITCTFPLQVSQHLDLNLSTLATAVLSKPVELLPLSLERSTFQMTQTTDATATCPGMVNAIAYWYNIHFHEDIPAVSTANLSSHVNQAAILFQSHVPVCDGQVIKLLIRFHQGLIHVEALQDGDSSQAV